MKLIHITVAILLASTISVNAIPHTPDTYPSSKDMKVQVVKGDDIPPENYTWFTQILVEVDTDQDGQLERRFICSGTLIAEDYVLTAAHCVTDPQTGEVMDDILWGVNVGYLCEEDDNCGRPSKQVPGKAFLPHPEWQPPNLFNDLALIQLDTPIDFIKPAKPDDGSNFWYLWPFLDLTVVGNGGTDDNRTLPTVVQEIEMNYIPTRWCEGWLGLPESFMSDDVVCAIADWLQGGTCNGDSGGSLILPTSRTGMDHDLVVGVTSFGLQLPWQPCTLKIAPDVFARVSNGYDWIFTNVCLGSSNPPSWCGEEETLIAPPGPATPMTPVSSTSRPTSMPTAAPTASPTDMSCLEEKDYDFNLDVVYFPGETRTCEWLTSKPVDDRLDGYCNNPLSTASFACPLLCGGCDPMKDAACKEEESSGLFVMDVESDLTYRRCKWLVKDDNRVVEFCPRLTSDASRVCPCNCGDVVEAAPTSP